jgi:hypothetical protein
MVGHKLPKREHQQHAHLDVAPGVEAVQLVHDLQHGALHLIVAARAVIETSAADGINLQKAPGGKYVNGRARLQLRGPAQGMFGTGMIPPKICQGNLTAAGSGRTAFGDPHSKQSEAGGWEQTQAGCLAGALAALTAIDLMRQGCSSRQPTTISDTSFQLLRTVNEVQ